MAPEDRPLAPSRPIAIGRRLLGGYMLRTGITADVDIPDRRSGAPIHVTLVPWEVDGTRYFMSQYGLTSWARNLRASGRGQLRLKGRTHGFTATEVTGEERDRVIAEFRSKADRLLSRDFERLPDPTDHPTFRLAIDDGV